VRVGSGVFRLSYLPEDAESEERVKVALAQAVPLAERWGAFRSPVDVQIHPNHAALEAATGLHEVPWVRGWARYGSLDLQSPRTWSHGPASESDLGTFITHELTHCVMYQAAAAAGTRDTRQVPAWFSEGMASVTAGEYHQAGYEAIWRVYRELPKSGENPLATPALFRSSQLLYGTAHLAFQFLLDVQGEQRIRRIMAHMGAGHSFEEAFTLATGESVAEFEHAFWRHVLSETWRE